jgi:hypothetical protein
LKKAVIFLLIIVVIWDYATESFAYLSNYNDSYGGFWQGLWHGIISFVTLPLSVWFPQNIHVYNSNNNGFAYNVGFFIPAICEVEASVPLLIGAWIIHIIF